jgi:spore coat-associated protein N
MRKVTGLLSKKIALTLAAVGSVSVLAAGGTYANFTATPVTIGSNAFAAGTLEMSRSGTAAIFSASGMAIGEEATGSVTITNTGSLPGEYTLSGSATGSLAGALNLVIYEDNDGAAGSKVYDGALTGVGSVALGTFAADGGAHTFYFHVVLPTTGTDAGDNAYQGQSADATFTWSATQA